MAGTALTVLRLVALAPGPHGVQDGLEAAPQVGQAVLHPGRHLGVYLAVDKALLLHIPQLGGQHLLRHAADGLLQFPEAFGPRQQVAQDEHLPLVPDQHQGGLDRAGGQFSFDGFRHDVFLQWFLFGNYGTIKCLLHNSRLQPYYNLDQLSKVNSISGQQGQE